MAFEMERITDTDEIRAVYREIEPGLREVVDNTPGCTWIPADIYWACQEQQALLLYGTWNGEYCGFAVIQIERNKYSGLNNLFIWAGYSVPAYRRNKVFLRAMEHIADMAREAGCEKVSFLSGNESLCRSPEHYGFRPGLGIVEREL